MFGGSGFLLASVFRAGLRGSRPFLLLPLFTQVRGRDVHRSSYPKPRTPRPDSSDSHRRNPYMMPNRRVANCCMYDLWRYEARKRMPVALQLRRALGLAVQ